MSGWTNSFSLLAKHGQKLGDSLFAFLAASDPETALEVDREKLEQDLHDAAVKLAAANRKRDDAQAALTKLQNDIANDQKAAGVLLQKLDAKEIDESVVTDFTDNLEDMQKRLPDAVQDAADAKEYADTLNEIVTSVKSRLEDFDRAAKQATRDIDRAKADVERQQMRAAQAQELEAMRNGTGTVSTALGALGQKATQLRDEAAALQTVNDVKAKPEARANAVEEARRIAAGTSTQGESAADRLRRLAGGQSV
ncbi:hypothetical protein [Novimethylophilus kurashikiensis]|nr:hypothetical protein [Novimethylophilus kurashikiensis]